MLEGSTDMRRAVTTLAIALGVLVIPSPSPAAAANPTVRVAPVLTGLDHAWDVGFASDGTMFATERPGRLWIRPANGTFHQLLIDLGDLWVSGETGFMSVEPDPGYVSNHRIYTCQGTTDFDFTVQVVALQVNAATTAATRVNDPLVGGIDGRFGRHGGCQLRIDASGALIVGTGDAALGTNPQNPHSLAGKTLRVDRFTGAGLPGNPFFGNPAAGDPRIQTLGHRNVQGLALQAGTNIMWSVEHGPDRDDEINQLINGKNYGWNPVNSDQNGYNESVPMTDHSIPNVQDAAWSSGIPTLATSGAAFLQGSLWGPWQGALAVSALKGSALQIFAVNAATNVATIIATPPELNGTVGRLRGAELGPSGILYVTTDNGNGTDEVLAVSPRVDKDGPAVGSSATNRIDQTARGFDDAVWERHSTGSFTAWRSLGGITTSDPDEAAWPGHVDVVVRGRDGAVWDRSATSGTFGQWTTLGGQVTSGPAAVSWGTGRTDAFARGTDGGLWANAFVTDHWFGWYPLGGQLTSSPDVASRSANRLDVFATGTDRSMWHRAWTGTTWTPWDSLGGRFTSGPGSVAVNGNRVDVFARGLDGQLWADTFAGAWSGWYALGGLLASDPDATSKAAGTEDVFVRGLDGEQWKRSFNGTTWSAWTQAL
jgi:glucose/arabinose dehydrogenase